MVSAAAIADSAPDRSTRHATVPAQPARQRRGDTDAVVLIARQERQASAVLGKSAGDDGTEAPGRAGDDDDTILHRLNASAAPLPAGP
jgi:hypothetical protein